MKKIHYLPARVLFVRLFAFEERTPFMIEHVNCLLANRRFCLDKPLPIPVRDHPLHFPLDELIEPTNRDSESH